MSARTTLNLFANMVVTRQALRSELAKHYSANRKSHTASRIVEFVAVTSAGVVSIATWLKRRESKQSISNISLASEDNVKHPTQNSQVSAPSKLSSTAGIPPQKVTSQLQTEKIDEDDKRSMDWSCQNLMYRMKKHMLQHELLDGDKKVIQEFKQHDLLKDKTKDLFSMPQSQLGSFNRTMPWYPAASSSSSSSLWSTTSTSSDSNALSTSAESSSSTLRQESNTRRVINNDDNVRHLHNQAIQKIQNSIDSDDQKVGLRMLHQAASRGSAQSCLQLGGMYFHGNDDIELKQDLTKATRLFKQASSLGNLDGTFNYSLCLRNGIGTAADETKAKMLLQRAALLGHEKSLNALKQWD